MAGGNEIGQPLTCLRNAVRRGDATEIEALSVRLLAQTPREICPPLPARGSELRLVHDSNRQKSRSAYQGAGCTPGKRSPSSGRKQGRDFSLEYHSFSDGQDAQAISPK